MEETFFVNSSSTDACYYVSVSLKKGLLKISCTCKAGLHDQDCKHKSAILSGNTALVHDIRQHKPLQKLMTTLQGTAALETIAGYRQRIAELDEQKATLDKQLKILKAEFGRKMRTGL